MKVRKEEVDITREESDHPKQINGKLVRLKIINKECYIKLNFNTKL